MLVTLMAKTTEEDMNQLEKDIRQLKIEYEQYFGGGGNRESTKTKAGRRIRIRTFGTLAIYDFLQRSRPRKEKSARSLHSLSPCEGTSWRRYRQADPRSVSAIRP